jgi:hypothetical protein
VASCRFCPPAVVCDVFTSTTITPLSFWKWYVVCVGAGATVSRCTREGSPVLLQEMKVPLSHAGNFSESLRRVVKLTRTQVAIPSLLSVTAVSFGEVAVDVYGPAVRTWLEMSTNASNHDIDLPRCVSLSSWLGDVTGGSGAPAGVCVILDF